MLAHSIKTSRVSNGKLSFKDLQRLLVIRCLYLFYLITGRRLQLIFISKPDAIVFSGGAFTLCWKVSGCYQVTLNDNMVLPGNSGSILLDAAQLSGPLRLCFYGCRQTIEKTYIIQPLGLHTKQLSEIMIRQPTLQTKKLCLHVNVVLPEKQARMQIPSLAFRAALSFRAERCATAIYQPTLCVLLDACELPIYNP